MILVNPRIILPSLVQVGTSSRKLKGEKYSYVESKLKAAGFKNISLYDLNDDGIFGWDKDKVESVSINGRYEFDEDDYFFPNSHVVISYH